MGFALISIAALMLANCATGRNHTPDSTLERRFLQYERLFEDLLSQVKSDRLLVMIAPDGLQYGDRLQSVGKDFRAVQRSGFTEDRWSQYQRLLHTLGLVRVLKAEIIVEFRAEEGSILNGDSYKGYMYSSIPAPHQKASLDYYRRDESDKDSFGNYVVTKRLRGNWYLYLFINGR